MTVTDSTPLWQRPLTGLELLELQLHIEMSDLESDEPEKGSPGQRATIWFFQLTARDLGFDSIQAMAEAQPQGKFSPWRYVLPEEQWHQIGQWILKASDDGTSRSAGVSELLMWMNRGPSGA